MADYPSVISGAVAVFPVESGVAGRTVMTSAEIFVDSIDVSYSEPGVSGAVGDEPDISGSVAGVENG